MKKFYAFIFALLFAQYTFAQWPANYGGVMLQGFYWDSYDDTKWTNLTAQADELSTYFDLIWVPNSGNCATDRAMGYMPVYWFDQRCAFGREAALRTMINTYKEKGTGIIEDVVFNHKAPIGKDGSWIDFANERWTWEETTYEINWTPADICNNDDGGDTKSKGWNVTGANDTGDDFGGGRDLDHTSANVQKNCKIFLDYLLKDLGYIGFRLDMVKGYGAQYTKMYNEHAQPRFCVGEYWDGSVSAVTNWINGTGKTSAAFDFPLKYVIRDAFGGGNWSALSNKGIAGSPDWQRYSVTFIDNHDTYENQDRLVNNVLAANAFILAMPGTPCIFLKHWQSYPTAIGNMILARKAAGITNQSSITKQQTAGGGYVLEVQGTKGSVLCLCGTPTYDTNGWKCISAGTNYAYYVSSNVTVDGLREDKVEVPECVTPIEGHIYAYFLANKDYTTPYAWVWGKNDKNFNKSSQWPGDKMTKAGEDQHGNSIYLWDGGEIGSDMPTGILFSNNGTPQTADFTFKNGGYYNADGYIADVTTSIQNTPIKTTLNTQRYNLRGQRVDDNYRGLVIENGKKRIYK